MFSNTGCVQKSGTRIITIKVALTENKKFRSEQYIEINKTKLQNFVTDFRILEISQFRLSKCAENTDF